MFCRRKRADRGEIEVPTKQIVVKLTIERIEELKKQVVEHQQKYKWVSVPYIIMLSMFVHPTQVIRCIAVLQGLLSSSVYFGLLPMHVV